MGASNIQVQLGVGHLAEHHHLRIPPSPKSLLKPLCATLLGHFNAQYRGNSHFSYIKHLHSHQSLELGFWLPPKT